MTLIAYPTRVHFADYVLEEALHSELEGAGLSAPLLLGEAPLQSSEICERVRAGLPNGSGGLSWGLPPDTDPAEAAARVAAEAAGQRVDVVIAFGAAPVIELGRRLRRSLSDAAGYRLPFYAVPGIDGLPDPCRRNLETWRTSLPTVLICDPTLIVGTGAEASLRSAVMSLVRGSEAYLAEAYNPPADGMALDAFRRSIALLSQDGAGRDLAFFRDLMAAALNASLSQDKGIGPAQMLAGALKNELGALDAASAARLILPGAIEAMRADPSKVESLGWLMGGGGWSAARLRDLLARVRGGSGPRRLSDLGLSRAHLARAAAEVARSNRLPEGVGQAVLEAVY